MEPSDIVERLNAACVGHPHASIPWPHRLLHEAMGEIERLREVEDIRRQMLAFAAAVKRLAFEMPPPNEYTPKFVQMALAAERIAREAGRQLPEERQRFGEGVASYATTAAAPLERERGDDRNLHTNG